MLRVAILGILLASTAANAAPHIESRDSDTGMPAWLTVNDEPMATAEDARAYLRTQIALLAPGAREADFVPLANHVDHRGIRTVTFAQTWRGIRVLGAAIGFVIWQGRLVAVRSSAWPGVTATARSSDRAAQVRAIEASFAATAHATFTRVIVPRVANGTIEYRVADLYDVRANQGRGEWDVYVTPDGEIVASRSRTRFATGTLEYNAGVRWAGGTRTTFPASEATILVDGISTTTAQNGSFTWAGAAPSTVVTSITGPYVRVINVGGASAMQTFTLAPGATAVWNASASELEDAQVSAFVYGSIAKARARIVNPSATAWLDQRLDVNVNDTSACNAQFANDAIYLYRSAGECENTARVGDIVFHELGHGLHLNSVINGIGDYEPHLAEGLADFFASNITGDPGMGRGFFKTNEPLRHIDPPGYERVYPNDEDFDPHISGLIIGGALWDLRKALVTILGAPAGIAQTEQIFTGIMQRADKISATYTAARIADDDDADLTNGTPNECALSAAFGRHGLVPGYVMTTVAPPVVSDHAISVRVTTPTGLPCPPLDVTSIKVLWSANDGVASEMALVASGDDWTGAFPEQPEGTVIHYSVDVVFSDGSLQSFPNNEADPRYQHFIGQGVALWCESFDADPQWEEISNAGREWQWAAPIVDPSKPDPDAPYSGAFVLGTDISVNGEYRANLRTAILTPAITVPTFQTVRLQYRRWLTVEDAAFDEATIEANDVEIWRNASRVDGTLDHVDREWRFHDLDVTPYVVDGALQLRWILDTDSSKELGGWTLDDACVIGLAKIPSCGDGELDTGEQCDDGNRENDDGCSATCIDEVEAGGGGCCSGGGGRGSWLLALAVLGALQRRRRVSSLVPSRSVSARIP